MENQTYNTSRVKPIYAYLKDSVKFYDTQNPFVAQVIFIMELAVIFGGYLFARPYTDQFFKAFEQLAVLVQEQFAAKTFDLSLLNSEIYLKLVDSLYAVILIILTIKALSYLISLFYGSYYYFSLVRPSMRTTERLTLFFRRLPKLIIFNIMFYGLFFFIILILMLVTTFAVMLMPFLAVVVSVFPMFVFILNALYVFKNFLIIEFDVGLFQNFKKSLDITKGCKKNIVFNALWPIAIGWIIGLFSADLQNLMLSLFITSFFEVIVLLISQRLTALMFIDAAALERQDKNTKQIENDETDA